VGSLNVADSVNGYGAAQARERIAEIIELADHEVLDIWRARAVEQEVLDLLDESPTR
jgi:hypothetical protein